DGSWRTTAMGVGGGAGGGCPRGKRGDDGGKPRWRTRAGLTGTCCSATCSASWASLREATDEAHQIRGLARDHGEGLEHSDCERVKAERRVRAAEAERCGVCEQEHVTDRAHASTREHEREADECRGERGERQRSREAQAAAVRPPRRRAARASVTERLREVRSDER